MACINEMIINNNITAQEPLIKKFTLNDEEVLPVITTVNTREILNISHFLYPSILNIKAMCNTELIDGRNPFYEIKNIEMMTILNLKNKTYILLMSAINNQMLRNEIIERNYPLTGEFFSDYLTNTQIRDIAHVCSVCLDVLIMRGEIHETRTEILAFYYLFANNSPRGNMVFRYDLKGYIIDLDFKTTTQHQRNLLWIDEDESLKTFNMVINANFKEVENNSKLLSIQGQLTGYRLETVKLNKEVDKILTLEKGQRILSGKPDNECFYFTYGH